jgi:hypothetical protein
MKNYYIISIVALIIILAAGYAFFPSLLQEDNIGNEEDRVKDSAVTQDTPLDYEHTGGVYSLKYPQGWFFHEQSPAVTIFTRFEEGKIPSGPELFTIGPIFSVAILDISGIPGVTTPDEWLAVNGFAEGNSDEFVKEHKKVLIGSLEMTRAVQGAPDAQGDLLSYIYFPDESHVIVLSHFPYDSQSTETKDFEAVIHNFVPQGFIALLAQFEKKLVYGVGGELDKAFLEEDCRGRGGTFNMCGTICDVDADICAEICALTCEFE